MDKFSLDATDIRILSAVQNHGQLSKTKLAEIVNLSPTPCWARLNEIEGSRVHTRLPRRHCARPGL